MKNFWQTKTLAQMSQQEWEALCDGCGLCCLIKLEDEDADKNNAEVFNTSVCCRLLDVESCRCSDYNNRFIKAPMCTQLSLENLSSLTWLPETCAYRRLNAGQALPAWHPLITKNKNSVHEAGISVKWFALSEEYIHPEQLSEFVITSFPTADNDK